jgi:outer membrane protein assembly factor BamA
MQFKPNPIKLTSLFFIGFFFITFSTIAQENKSFRVYFKNIDSIAINHNFLTSFSSITIAKKYIQTIPSMLINKGFSAASIDSVQYNDSSATVSLYTGLKFKLINVQTTNIDQVANDFIGFDRLIKKRNSINLSQLKQLEEKLLQFYMSNGYPFAAVEIDSISMIDDQVSARLYADKGNRYLIDSIRVFGEPDVKTYFFNKHLQIENGSNYNKTKLQKVDKRLSELNFIQVVQPSDLTMLGSGSILNLYLKKKKSSQINFLIGLQPASNNNQKLQLTGDFNLDLKNNFSTGENIVLKWQQLQPASPRLILNYNQPYIFQSSIGTDCLFELFKKDSNFIQINAQLGFQFLQTSNQKGKIFLQWQNNKLLSGAIDTSKIKLQKSLPVNLDIKNTNLGLNMEWNTTNYKMNPQTGSELDITAQAGTKTIIKNNKILEIKDSLYPYTSLYDSLKLKSYQIKFKAAFAHYFKLSKFTVLKTSFKGGFMNSPNLFRNELFQIGGFKTLRGFNEESIYAKNYAVFTSEYRILLGLNAHLSFFGDWGFVKTVYSKIKQNEQYKSLGVGMVFETKTGLLNLSYSLGMKKNEAFNFRESSKLHFGYVNYF